MVEALQGTLGVAQAVFRVVDGTAVVAGHQQVANHLRVVLFEHITDGEEVVQRLRHLLAIDTDHAAVHPGVGVLLAGGRLALGNLVLVVRELQVAAATMNVEALTQAAGGHHRALDVPARTARAPWRLPAWLARLDALPQHEIERVLLGLVDLDAGADAQVFDLLARQLAVAHELADAVVHVAIARRVGIPLVDQGLDHRVHAGDMVGGTRFLVWRQDVQAALVFVHRVDHARREGVEAFAVLVGPVDDLVIDVGDIAHVGQLVTALAQPAGDQVERHHAAAVAQVAVVVHGHAANVHAHLVAIQRLEGFLGFGQGVVDG